MESIAAKLELTKPALYRYFRNKNDLYYAVVLRGTIILADMMDKEVASQNNGIKKIAATGLAYCKFYKKYPDYSKILLEAKANFNPVNDSINLEKLIEYSTKQLTIMCNAIETGKKDGTIRIDIDTFMTALYLIESTTAILQLSENTEVVIKSMGLNKEEFLRHSFKLMGNSIENNEKEI